LAGELQFGANKPGWNAQRRKKRKKAKATARSESCTLSTIYSIRSVVIAEEMRPEKLEEKKKKNITGWKSGGDVMNGNGRELKKSPAQEYVGGGKLHES